MRLLWVEDDPSLRRVYRRTLAAEVDLLLEAEDPTAARAQASQVDVVLLDLMLPPTGRVDDGLALLEELVCAHPHLKVVVLTGSGDRKVALSAIARGAFDFLHKPVDPDVLLVVLQRAFSRVALERTLDEARTALTQARPTDAMIGQSPTFLQAVELADRVAGTDMPVLITGENGTGKELVARRIHAHSPRAGGPFVVINCGALPPNLLESTLFGHRKGAFTGADAHREGVFQAASGGTLFLDEVGELEPPTQVRLLRALENHEIHPVGADRPIRVDVRFLAATNRDLEALVAEGAFRDDLYWRLRGLEVLLPPLRDRHEDIELLARHFLAEAAGTLGRRHAHDLGDDALSALRGHAWPGNLRELRHALQRGALMAGGRGVIHADDLGLRAGRGPDGDTLAEQVERLERRVIKAALAAEGGNHSRAALRLGLSRQGLLNKLDRFELR